MRKKVIQLIFTFRSTTDAIAAERTFRRADIPGRTIPVPRTISASCGLSWRTDEANRDTALRALENAGIAPEGLHLCEIFV